MVDRDNAVQSGKTARTALASVLVTAPAPLRDQLRHIPPERRARACAELGCPAGADRLTRVVHQTLIRLGQRAIDLTQAADDLEAQITEIVEDMAPGLVAAEYGLGALTAAQILLSWSHAGRDLQRGSLRDARRAPPQSRCPPAAPTGTASTRLGDRQLKRALHAHRRQPHVAATRQPGPAQSAAGAGGKTGPGVPPLHRRCYLARHLYRALRRQRFDQNIQERPMGFFDPPRSAVASITDTGGNEFRSRIRDAAMLVDEGSPGSAIGPSGPSVHAGSRRSRRPTSG